MAVFFCPRCFVTVVPHIRFCPNCGTDMIRYLRDTPYPDRLIHALRHPESETRMAAIIALGHMAYAPATQPLLASLVAWPADVVQGAQVLVSLAQIGTAEARAALQSVIHDHPSAVLQHLAARTLAHWPATGPGDSSPDDSSD